MKRVFAGVILLAAVVALIAREPAPRPERLVAHEWGTFTSVANDTGNPAQWAPWSGPPDLPCFVYRDNAQLKWKISGLVRMETPVIYFYASQAMKVSARVDFPKGLITEWYPSSSSFRGMSNSRVPMAEGGIITWNDIEVMPDAKVDLLHGKGASHYYTARATDAASLRVNKETEKLLFYRGVGSFAPPLRAWYPGDGKLWLHNAGKEPIETVIVFENRGDKVGFRIVPALKDEIAVEPPQMNANLSDLHGKLQHELVAAGLYEKEAAAMIETWRDSWFEKGTRVFYLMPRPAVDRVLPLKITPAPEETVRVFVARLELLSPWMENEITNAANQNDVGSLREYGRFLPVFAQTLKISSNGAVRQAQAILASMQHNGCVQ